MLNPELQQSLEAIDPRRPISEFRQTPPPSVVQTAPPLVPVPSLPGPKPDESVPRQSLAVKSAPPVPVKMVGKAPPPVPLAKMSIGGKSGVSGHPVTAVPASEKVSNVSELVNIHWKPASGHAVHGSSRLSLDADQDQFLRPFPVTKSQQLDRLVRENPLPDVLLGGSDRSHTVFDTASSNLPSLATEALKQFFARKQNTKFDSSSANQSSTIREEGGSKKSGLDRERVKLIALALGGAISSRANRRLIFRQYREAIIRCDYESVTTDIMCPLLQLLKNVSDEEQSTCLSFVLQEVRNSQLPEAQVLEEFEEPDVFLFEMSKIPEIKIRLECMIFERTFDDLFHLTVSSLNVIYAGLEVIANNVDKITKLFQLILKAGNFLNEGSKIGSHQASFSLSTLSKLTEVKSSVDPKLDVLHFILSHIPPDDACLFTDEETIKLRNASNLRCYRVRDEVKDLLDSILAVSEIVKHPVQSASDDDRFTLRMTQFSQRIKGTDQWLSKYAFNVFASYKRLSLYFEDSKTVYPPPKEKAADQFDIIELFAWFGGVVKAHEKDIKKKGLRNRLDGANVSSSPVSGLKTSSPPMVSPPEASPSPIATAPVQAGSIDFNYTLEGTGRSKSITGSSSQLILPGSSSAVRPSLTREQLQSSLSNLGSPAAPPLVAIINRGFTGRDLTASKPKLSPVPAPVIDVSVTPAVSPPTTPEKPKPPIENVLKPPPFPPVIDTSRRVLSVKDLMTGTPGRTPTNRPHILITPHGGGANKSRPDISISVLPGMSKPDSGRQQISAENGPPLANKLYPSRNDDGFPNYAVLNSRQSLSNTISRVAMLLSPSKDDGSIYKGTRRRVPSLTPDEAGDQ